MSIKVSMTGSGTIGPIIPGWNVQEYATPNVLGNTAGGTGSVGFSARAEDDSLLINNNDVTTSDDTLGSIIGIVKNVSQSGSTVSVSHSNALDFYDSTKIIPPIRTGNPATALDICSQISGISKFRPVSGNSTARFWSLAGHDIGFEKATQNADGSWSSSQIKVITDGNDSVFCSSTSALYTGYNGSENYSGIYLYSSDVQGFTFDTSKQNNLSFKCAANNTYVYVGFFSIWFDGSSYIYNQHFVTFDNATRVLTTGVIIDYSGINGSPVVVSSSTTLSYIDNSKEYTLSFCCNVNNSVGATIEQDFLGSPTVLGYVVSNQSAYQFQYFYVDRFTITGTVRSLMHSTNQLNQNTYIDVGTYELIRPYNINYSMTFTYSNPVPSVEMNMWEYIQQACAATGNEVYVSSVNDNYHVPNVPSIRAVASVQIDVTNNVGAVSTSVSSSFSAKSVNISYTDSANVYRGEIYNALTEEQSPIEIKSGEVVELILQGRTSPTAIFQPIRRTSLPNSAGSYIISDSTGVIVGGSGSATAWEDFGGSLTVSLSTEVAGGIVVRIVAPATDIPAYPGPYKIAYYDSVNWYPALSILGSGVSTSPKTIELQSGADQTKTSKNKSSNIDNVFIATKAMAYDRGIWATENTSGPVVSISLSIPTNEIRSYYSGQDAGFGVTPGSIITYNKSKYRVTDCSINNISISINAVRHVNVFNFQSSWSVYSPSITVGNYDALNSGLQVQDSTVKPLYN